MSVFDSLDSTILGQGISKFRTKVAWRQKRKGFETMWFDSIVN